MKSGNHVQLEQFINMHSLEDQTFDMTGEYYTLHNYDLDGYDRKFAILDYRLANTRLTNNPDFGPELKRRCDLLHSQGFVFIKANPWESEDNLLLNPPEPQIDIKHILWCGGVSWFWFYMYDKHRGTQFHFDHSNKNMTSYILTSNQDHTEKNCIKSYLKMVCWKTVCIPNGQRENCLRSMNFLGHKTIQIMAWIKTYSRSHTMILLVVLFQKPMTMITMFL